ncbi:MAG TPA: hypothetical protein DIU00_12680 [Phycisphaerales bacterium]|nr:hypothetical protein [Phycisphaerales bacterium]
MDLNNKVENRNFFTTNSEKSIQDFIESVKENALRFNFGVRRVFDMREEYRKQNVNVDDDFQLYQIMVCNYGRSYRSMSSNMERAAILLQPKQIIAYTEKGVTTVNYLPFTKEFVKQAMPQDDGFQESLPESCQRIIRLIEASK